MKRREFITLLGGAAAAWPFAAGAQQPGMPVIGFLGAATPAVASQWLAAFVQRLDELGWVGGRNVMIEVRWAEGRGERAAEIAAEFVRSKVNIVATWSTAAALAAKSATSTIPVVRSDARQRDVAGGDPPQTMTPARGREMIDFVRAAFQVSIRRACRTVPACRATYHYRSRRSEQAPLRKRIRAIAETRMRYGYRRKIFIATHTPSTFRAEKNGPIGWGHL
jgi:hypothetical protein